MLSTIKLNKKESVHGYWYNAREDEVIELITKKIDSWIRRKKLIISYVK